MTDQSINVRLPAELCHWLDTIRFSETTRIGRQWTQLPASRGEVLEMLAWRAHGAVQRDS